VPVDLALDVHCVEARRISVFQCLEGAVAISLEGSRGGAVRRGKVQLLDELRLLLLRVAVMLDHHLRELLDAWRLGLALGQLPLIDLGRVHEVGDFGDLGFAQRFLRRGGLGRRSGGGGPTRDGGGRRRIGRSGLRRDWGRGRQSIAIAHVFGRGVLLIRGARRSERGEGEANDQAYRSNVSVRHAGA
jgi:hypothetical protein